MPFPDQPEISWPGPADHSTRIRTNQSSFPNYGDRYRNGEPISSSLAESSVNQIISKRFVKRQQMRWSRRGAHLLLQVRTRVLDETEEQLLEAQVAVFLADLAHTNHSPQTLRAYTTDLAQLCAFYQGLTQTITAEVLRTFFGTHAHLQPATRARKQAAVARFLT